MIHIVVPGEPTAKGRPRFRQWKAKDGRAGVTAYTPGKTQNAEAFIKERAVHAMTMHAYPPFPSYERLEPPGSPRPLEGPIAVTMVAHFRIPPSWSKRKQADARAGAIAPTARPDIDNLIKLYGDALNGICWLDDSQIVECTLRKRYSDQPRVELTVEPWTAQATATAARSAA